MCRRAMGGDANARRLASMRPRMSEPQPARAIRASGVAGAALLDGGERLHRVRDSIPPDAYVCLVLIIIVSVHVSTAVGSRSGERIT